MSSQHQAQSVDKSPAKQQTTRSEAPSVETPVQQLLPTRALQKAQVAPPLLTAGEVLHLQRTVGNRAVAQLLAAQAPSQRAAKASAQPSTPATGYSNAAIQRTVELQTVMGEKQTLNQQQIIAWLRRHDREYETAYALEAEDPQYAEAFELMVNGPMPWNFGFLQATEFMGTLRALAGHEPTEGENQPSPLDPPRHLHVFVNLEGIPANRVAVFIQHFMGRLETSGGLGTALNIKSNLEVEDISRRSHLTVGEPEEKGGNTNTSKGVEKLRQQVNTTHSKYRKHLTPQSEEPDKYDEVVVIGVAKPGGKPGEDDMYSTYQNVSGIPDIEGLSAQIKALVQQNLKAKGHLRVQLCHAGSVKVNEEQTFSESLVPPEKKEMTISAPKNFSIIGDEGDYVDLTTKMGIFDKIKGQARGSLLGALEIGSEQVNEPLQGREKNFRSKIKGGESVNKLIRDMQFGNGKLAFNLTSLALRRRPKIGFYLPAPVEEAYESGLLRVGQIFDLNGMPFRLQRNQDTGEIAMFRALRGG